MKERDLKNGLFTKAIQVFLEQYGIEAKSPQEIYIILHERELPQKAGIWKAVGRLTGRTTRQAHDYYHNTWSEEFYDDIKSLRPELKRYVMSQPPDVPSAQLARCFQRLHPCKRFHMHQLEQAICIIRLRMKAAHRPRADFFDITDHYPYELAVSSTEHSV